MTIWPRVERRLPHAWSLCARLSTAHILKSFSALRGQEIHSCPEFLQLPGGPMAPTCGWHHPGLPPLRATQHSPTPLRGPAQKAEFWSWSGHTSAGRGTWARRRSRVTGVHIIPWPLPHRISVRPVLLPGPSPV